MSIATVYSRAILGVDAVEVIVETHLSSGLPAFAIVGLPETAVRESKERVRSAIINAGLEFPDRRITVNLAPADLPKTGGKYDLAIAVSILAASGQVDKARIENSEILGELALDGRLRKLDGIVPAIVRAKKSGRKLYLPAANRRDLAWADYAQGNCVGSLLELVDHLCNGRPLQGIEGCSASHTRRRRPLPAAGAIMGQGLAKRALQIAASGSHHMVMVGPPGSGKTLLANCLVALLPDLEQWQALELAGIKSVSDMPLDDGSFFQPPMRSPHHSATPVALLGGGRQARPGEISLANHGVLFLDELAEFKSSVLDSLREPLESGEIHISRANFRVCYPARFQLIAAMNPCPCGYANDAKQECNCTPQRIRQYLGRLSGPMLDRLDLLVEVPGLSSAELLNQRDGTPTDWHRTREQVRHCRERQLSRAGKLNGALTAAEIARYCCLGDTLKEQLSAAMDKLRLSARATHGILKVARTIADVEDRQAIEDKDLFEALSFRQRRLWGSATTRF